MWIGSVPGSVALSATSRGGRFMLSRGVAREQSLHNDLAATSQLASILKLEDGVTSSDETPISKGLILAQNERWRRGLGMQVGRAARPVAQG